MSIRYNVDMTIICGKSIISFPVWTPALTLGIVIGLSYANTNQVLFSHSLIIGLGITGLVLTALCIRWFTKKNDSIQCRSITKRLQIPIHDAKLSTKYDLQCVAAEFLQGIRRITEHWHIRKIFLSNSSGLESFLIGMSSSPIGGNKIANTFHKAFGIEVPPELSATESSKEWRSQVIMGLIAAMLFGTAVILLIIFT